MAEQTSAEVRDNQTTTEPEQPSAPEKTAKVNLFELPEFRQVQANYDRRLADAEARARRFEQQIEAITTRDMTEEELTAHRTNKVYQYAQSLEQQLAAERANLARVQDFQRLSDTMERRFGVSVPFSAMERANDPAHAAELATEYVANALDKQRKAERREGRKEANEVDVGGGSASTPASRDSDEYKNARSSADLLKAHYRAREDARRGRRG